MALHHHKHHHQTKQWVSATQDLTFSKWVAGKPATRCSAKGETPGEGTGKILASYACKSVCGGPCQDGEWHKTGEDRKGCAWVSSFPAARCKVWGEVPGEEGRVRAATACPDSCA